MCDKIVFCAVLPLVEEEEEEEGELVKNRSMKTKKCHVDTLGRANVRGRNLPVYESEALRSGSKIFCKLR